MGRLFGKHFLKSSPGLMAVAAVFSLSLPLSLGSVFTWSPPATAYNFQTNLASWSCYSHTDGPYGYRVEAIDGVTGDGHDGKSVACFTSTDAKQPHDYDVVIFQKFSGEKYYGSRLVFKVWAKAENLVGDADLWVKVNNDDDVVAFNTMENKALKAGDNGDWRELSIAIDVPRKATSITIGFAFSGGGKVWLSDPSLAGGDLSSASNLPGGTLTMVAWDEKKYWVYADELRKAPVNFDFAQIATERGPRQILTWSMIDDDREYEMFDDRDTLLQGKPSACIASTAEEPKGYASIYQDISAAQYRGKRLKFSAFLKTADVKDWSGLWMRVKNTNDVLAFDNMEKRPVKGTTKFSEYSVVLDVPDNAKAIRMGFMQAGAGKTWMSNCALNVVNAATTKTTGDTIDLSKIASEHLPVEPDMGFHAR